MKTKRRYITPEICEYNIQVAAMICQSAIESGGNDDFVELTTTSDSGKEIDGLKKELKGFVLRDTGFRF